MQKSIMDWDEWCLNTPVEHMYCYREDMPFNLRRIYPLKQKEVCEIYDYLRKIDSIKSVYIFGSASNMKCSIFSDTDIAIDCTLDHSTRSKLLADLFKLCSNDCDVVWLDSIYKDSKLYSNIKKGVRII